MRGTLVDRCDQCGAFLRKMTPEQHAAVEAVYEDLSWQVDFPKDSGQMWDQFGWHQIMVGLFAEENGWQPKFVPTPSGGMIPVLRTKQSRLTKKQGSELIEFAKAYAAERGAVVREWDEQGNLISDPPLAIAA